MSFSNKANISGSMLVGEVDGYPIYWSRTSKFQRYVKQLELRYKTQYKITDEIMKFIKMQAFNSVSLEILLNKYADKNSVYIEDNDIREKFRSDIFSQYSNVTEKDYADYIKRMPSSERSKTEENVRESLKTMYLQNDLFMSVPVSSLDLLSEYKLKNTKRKVSLIYFNAEDFVDSYKISDDTLKNFMNSSTNYPGKKFNDIKDDLKTDYINSSIDIIMEGIKSKHRKDMDKFKNEAKGNNFQALAKKYNLTIYKSDLFYYGGPIKTITGDSLYNFEKPEIYESAFSLPNKTFSEVINLKRGFVVVIPTGKVNPNYDNLNNDKMKSEIVGLYQDIRKQKSSRIRQNFLVNLRSKAKIVYKLK